MTISVILSDQAGVISRRQVLGCGESDPSIERRLRRREWARVHPGVYVNHTGPLTWEQRAWAAVLFYAPAALAAASALRAAGMSRHSDESGPLEVVVAAERRVDRRDAIHVRRLSVYDEVVMVNKSPPRVTIEHAVLTVASRACSDDDAVAVIADACQSRRTSADRLSAQIEQMLHLSRRRLLRAILEDVASGTYSALERRYLGRVERPHGLPTGSRQRRVRTGRSIAYRDVNYIAQATVVELDGRLGHEHAADQWADLDRDIASIAAGDLTVRAGWGQVLQPCRLAAAIARILRARGWSGAARPCGPACPVVDA